ncbi:MBL fold metallo-hydrolase [Anoxynatronum buryatiense]|uniref:Glyoxylase, beta-lactamase superfamily II n=1 Tax=Anoxynatronum buryatiense TaxID=489973 RepID=A0AA45WXI6_9CLOT|nr:MBL fold metallo-hydrolase [Anoxynatronum buryatiense]SMP64180.1 Glyoxylase, beta-lactamase superfamily II [Anoxynatronum buryatiense]
MNKRRVRKLTDRVWMIVGSNRGIQPNVGIINNGTQTVLIDCGNGPVWGTFIQEVLASMKAPPVSHIIYTHHHWDHVFGAMSFDAPIIAHEKCLDYLKVEAQKPWSAEFLKQEAAKYPQNKTSHDVKIRAVHNWDDFHIRLPQTTFRERMVIELADGRLLLDSTNSLHSEDSILIYDEHDQVMFTGDAFYPPPYHERKTHRGDVSAVTKNGFSKIVLSQMLTYDFKTVVHGHGMPLRRDDVIRELGDKAEELNT